MSRYQILVMFGGGWGLYQTADTLKAAKAVAARVSWPTRIQREGK